MIWIFCFCMCFCNIFSWQKKSECIQQHCVALCYIWLFSPNSIGSFYANALWRLVFALCVRVDINLPQFFLLIFLYSKSCWSSMDIIHLHVPTWNLWDFPLFYHSAFLKKISARCVVRCLNEVFKYSFVCFVSLSYMLSVLFLLFMFVCCAASVIGHLAVDPTCCTQELCLLTRIHCNLLPWCVCT
jgi:hypothetical protein